MNWTEAHKWIVRNGDEPEFDEEKFARYLAAARNPNVATLNGCTLLHFAALSKCAGELIPYLLRHGAQHDLVDSEGATPLHWAVRNPDTTATQLLLALQ